MAIVTVVKDDQSPNRLIVDPNFKIKASDVVNGFYRMVKIKQLRLAGVINLYAYPKNHRTGEIMVPDHWFREV